MKVKIEKKIPTKIDFQINPEEPIFVISIVSQKVGIPIWTLRKLDDLGVVKPKRIGKKTRCYSMAQLKQLTYVHYLMETEHVNISGIKIFLEMKSGAVAGQMDWSET